MIAAICICIFTKYFLGKFKGPFHQNLNGLFTRLHIDMLDLVFSLPRIHQMRFLNDLWPSCGIAACAVPEIPRSQLFEAQGEQN